MAQILVSYCHFYMGEIYDVAKAIAWCRKGGDRNDDKSQFKLGSLYRDGENRDFPKDLYAARGWFQKSADFGNADAQFELDRMPIKGKFGAEDFRGKLIRAQSSELRKHIAYRRISYYCVLQFLFSSSK